MSFINNCSLGDPVIDWEETVYLNLILQQVRNYASSLFDPNAVSLKDLFGLHIVHHVHTGTVLYRQIM